MKNVLFIVVDSFGNKNSQSLNFDVTPFLSELKQKSLYYSHMYSQAPYTEAAVMSMLCGHDTLDNGGYYYRYRDSKNLFDCFYENNYQVINYIQPHVFPSSIIRGNTHYYYNVCFDFNVLWEYRLYFYQSIRTKLTNLDYTKIEKLIDDNFMGWIQFFKEYLHNDDSISLIKNNIERTISDKQVKESLDLIEEQFTLYKVNNKEYIDDLLELGKQHILFNVPVLNQNVKISSETKKWLKKNYYSLFKGIYAKNKKMNKKISKFKLFDFLSNFHLFLKTKDKNDIKNALRYIKNYRDAYVDNDLFERIGEEYDAFKAAPSIHQHFEHFINVLEKKEDNRPFFGCLHIDDIHNPEIFFTYDTDDKEVLKEELDLCQDIFNRIDDKEIGSVSYYLSLAYIDLKLKKIFEKLEELKILDDTYVVITGDHGFSFDNRIIRNSRVNNFYLENYQVPLIIYSKDIKTHYYSNKCSSKDILPTLVDLCQLETDAHITGISLLNDRFNDVITTEYVGGGCPELEYREVFITAQNNDWMIVGRASLINNTDISIKEVYHLAVDVDQRKNLAYSHINNCSYEIVFKTLQERVKELRINYSKWKL